MRTFQHTVAARAGGDADRVADRQRAALRKTAGRWEDGRDTAEIIAEIEAARTARYHISRPKPTGNADGAPMPTRGRGEGFWRMRRNEGNERPGGTGEGH